MIDGETLATRGLMIPMNGALTAGDAVRRAREGRPGDGRAVQLRRLVRQPPARAERLQVRSRRRATRSGPGFRFTVRAPSTISPWRRRYAVFYVSPYLLDMPAIAAARRCWRRSPGARTWGAGLSLVSRRTGDGVCSIAIEGRYSLHTINCAEADGLVVFDVVEMPAPVYDAYGVPGPVRRGRSRPCPCGFGSIPARGVVTSREELACDCAPEFAVAEAGTCSARVHAVLGTRNVRCPE